METTCVLAFELAYQTSTNDEIEMGRISLKKHQSSAAKKPLKTKKSSGSHIQVIAEDPSENPHCERHGPVLKFRETFDDGRPPSIFYGCSANRDRNSCPFSEHPAAKENLPVQRAAAAEAYETRLMQHAELLAKIRALPAINRAYCGKCSSFVLLPAERHLHNEHSAQLQQSITDEQLQKPTLLLQPLDRDKTEAQYFFDANTLAGIQRMLSAANIRRVVCIGAPRLHEHLRAERESLQIYSVLLDLDERLEPFYERQEFYRFNMFNGWFPDGDARGAEFDAWLRADKRYVYVFLHRVPTINEAASFQSSPSLRRSAIRLPNRATRPYPQIPAVPLRCHPQQTRAGRSIAHHVDLSLLHGRLRPAQHVLAARQRIRRRLHQSRQLSQLRGRPQARLPRPHIHQRAVATVAPHGRRMRLRGVPEVRRPVASERNAALPAMRRVRLAEWRRVSALRAMRVLRETDVRALRAVRSLRAAERARLRGVW